MCHSLSGDLFDSFLLARRPSVGQGILIHEVSASHTTTHGRTVGLYSGRVIGPSQRPLPDNTQYSKQTDIHALGGIRTHNLSRRAAADLRLRMRGRWDRLTSLLGALNWLQNRFIVSRLLRLYCAQNVGRSVRSLS